MLGTSEWRSIACTQVNAEVNVMQGRPLHERTALSPSLSHDILSPSGLASRALVTPVLQVERKAAWVHALVSTTSFTFEQKSSAFKWLAQKNLTATVVICRASITSLSWSRDGRHLASGSQDNTAVLWDVLKGTQV